MSDPLATITTRRTPQAEQADPRQVPNQAGGYVFQVDDMARLRRFLTLGTTGGTYYQGERELTKDNAALVLDLARTRGLDVVNAVVDVSVGGRAPKQQPGLFALAAVIGLGDVEARRAAAIALPAVARTGSTLLTFIGYAEQFRGWGPVLKRAVADWFLRPDADWLGYQVAKYRQRGGWSQRDALRLSHPRPADGDLARRSTFDFVCGRTFGGAYQPPILDAFIDAQRSPSAAYTAALVREHIGLSWEMVQSDHLNDPDVLRALLDQGMPPTALLRNLPRLTRAGVLTGDHLRLVTDQLVDPERLRKARVHPVNVLVAARTYALGHSTRGDGVWTPVPAVVDALDAAFYAAFGAVEPTGKRILLAVDVSRSMGTHISGLPISAREVAAALALVTLSTEPHAEAVGFTATLDNGYGRAWGGRIARTAAEALTPLDISPRRRLDDVVTYLGNMPFGGTDCALPWTWARETGREFDGIVTLTDNETWAGPVHVHQAQRAYREAYPRLHTRSVAVALTATAYSVNDPADPLGLDVPGFDSAVPQVIADFAGARI